MAAKDLPACGLPEMGSGEGPSPPWFAFRGFLPPAQDDSGGAFVILSRRKLAFEQEHGGEGPSRGRPSRDGFRRRSFAAVVCAPWLFPPAQDDSGCVSVRSAVPVCRQVPPVWIGHRDQRVLSRASPS